ncbi:43 kDa receptor-associated protein of the synapse homolog isoform X1 [Athalia rosae]|uniref:43 kDa receptor-associated protein of the synapse homolog isoform X1 n=1 Tax=Athalia rosae TaxID=37344 RepID=UPI000A0EE33A|nr:43 kDa receptor-associated protein of the synapse homolog isoform X1 [Athalia rosae]XP_020710637.1 43 kDa receptor-associated protein of the synapse homolog isoform X1 [Athalia rosae]XP_020710638.1 43 kDa receptor-associated protein of the synapse homolog isoform X1 [Athalia rosae]XP_048505130.1 43 kDa receptor-associated protein of the synapse homolog isoform X1 [Athalia rosae]XP_048505131.1 43 kDa receptor-associated protein of the synapse homolog isoform X1 [Athalia rosae]
MSWESIASREYLSGSASHQLSATALLGSPDGSRHPLDVYEFAEEDYRHQNGNGSGHYQNGRAGLWECLVGCRHRLDQQLARRRVEQGLKLYRAHKQQAAVRKWSGALKSIRQRDDKFTLLGYLYQAYMDWGKYRESIDFAHKQLCISEELDSPNMRAEAYLNLARAHERLGALDRALAYARHSLFNECDQCATAGLVHLTVARVHLELAGFCKALEAFQRAHKIAQSIQDPSLELQVYVGLSELFSRLQDADKSARYAAKAYDLSRSLQLGDLNSRHHRAALLQMAAALRKQGELGDAHDYCSEATRLSVVSGDQASYARSIRIMGDIYRKKSDINLDILQKAFCQYESAMGSAASTGDRLCQMEAMDGAARCLEALRLQHKICNCRPLEFNTRLLEVAGSVGAKLLVRTVRSRLSRIYGSLGDEEQRGHHERLAAAMEEDLELRCGGCSEPFGLEADLLEALPCSHILHARCAYDILKRRDKKKKRLCPDCHKSVSSRLYLHCEDPHGLNALNHSSLSLASLRASSLATLEDCHATSSV